MKIVVVGIVVLFLIGTFSPFQEKAVIEKKEKIDSNSSLQELREKRNLSRVEIAGKDIMKKLVNGFSQRGKTRIVLREKNRIEFLWYDKKFPLTIDIVWGNRSKKIIYLLPGSGSNFQSSFLYPRKRNIVDFLLEKGYLVIGITPREDRVPYVLKKCECLKAWGLERHREDIRKVISIVKREINISYEILGFSAGAIYALDYAARYNNDTLLKRIILFGAIGEFDPVKEKALRENAKKSELAVEELIKEGKLADDSVKMMKLLAIMSTLFPKKDSGVERENFSGNFTLEGLAYYSLIHTNRLDGPTTKYTGLPEQWYYKQGLCAGRYTFRDNPREDSYELFNTQVSVMKRAALKVRSGLFPQVANKDLFSIFCGDGNYTIPFKKIKTSVLWINSELGLGNHTFSLEKIRDAGNRNVRFYLVRGYAHADLVYGEKAEEDVWYLIDT